jgi:hypothetical protein
VHDEGAVAGVGIVDTAKASLTRSNDASSTKPSAASAAGTGADVEHVHLGQLGTQMADYWSQNRTAERRVRAR